MLSPLIYSPKCCCCVLPRDEMLWGVLSGVQGKQVNARGKCHSYQNNTVGVHVINGKKHKDSGGRRVWESISCITTKEQVVQRGTETTRKSRKWAFQCTRRSTKRAMETLVRELFATGAEMVWQGLSYMPRGHSN